jgi:hypothetical protein
MTIKTPTARKSFKTALLAMASLATLLSLSAPAAIPTPHHRPHTTSSGGGCRAVVAL